MFRKYNTLKTFFIVGQTTLLKDDASELNPEPMRHHAAESPRVSATNDRLFCDADNERLSANCPKKSSGENGPKIPELKHICGA